MAQLTNPVFPYICVRMLNMDRLVLFFTIQSPAADRRARLVRPSTPSDPVHIAVETVAENLGRAPGSLIGRVGTPWAGISATSYVNLDTPFQVQLESPALGALVLGGAPDTVVSTSPVPVAWAQAPAIFPPAIPTGAPAWRLRPACGRVARSNAAYSGTAYSIVDNTVSANELRALPVEDVAGGSTIFALAWCPASSRQGYRVTLTLAWPGSLSVPASRVEYCPVTPKRCLSARWPGDDPALDPDLDATLPTTFGRCGDGPRVRLPPPQDPTRLPIQATAPTRPRRICYPPT